MKRINIDRGWEFSEEKPALYYVIQGMSGKLEVDLPHDAGIGKSPSPACQDGVENGYMQGTLGVYTKYFDLPAEWEGQRVLLELDGAYCNAEINLNGNLMGMHPNGYCPYVCDLTPRLIQGKNRLAIFVNNSMQRTSRWYAGTGIYRHAYLRVAPQIHLSANAQFLHTEYIDEKGALVCAEISAENHTGEEKKVYAKIDFYQDRGHNEPHAKESAAHGECVISLPANGKGKGVAHIYVPKALLWSTDTPNLYVSEVRLYGGEQELDADEALFGIRTITVDAANGLRINGKSIKLKGGCVHHDNGILGAASFYDSEYRRMKLHKDNGFNAIRCAHNPMSRDMTEACDRLGLLIFAEAFDVWNMSKNINDYHTYFADWWERDLTAFIKRDRNHPSIFCWSVGNEVVERNGLQGGAETCAKLAAKVRELDSSRPVTAAVPTLFNGMNDADTLSNLQAMMAMGGPAQNLSTPWSMEVWGDRTEAFCAPLDFVGYNYLDFRYGRDHVQYPNRVICGTESYPDRIAEIWESVERYPHVIGDFVWTSHDYLGETGCGVIRYRPAGSEPIGRGELQSPPYPARTANCSCFDLTGKELPSLAYHRIAWGSRETYIAAVNPAVYGMENSRTAWAWEDCENAWCNPGYEGKTIWVDVYTSAAEAELLINGKSCGRKKVGENKKNIVRFDAVYESGTVEAISYDASGKEISRQKLTTPGEACRIALKADKTQLKADGQSLAFVEVQLTDKEGNLVPRAEDMLAAEVSGKAKLAAFGSANPVTEEMYTAGRFTSYKGRLLAIVRAGYEAGEAVLKISGEKFGAAEIRFNIK